MNKRKRVDGMEGFHELLTGAIEKVQLPAGIDLNDDELVYWSELVDAKATRSWTKPDLLLLSDLSRIYAKIQRYEGELISVNLEDALKIERVIDMLARRARMLTVTLQIHAGATQGNPKDQRSQNEAHRRALDMVEDLDDELIAKPQGKSQGWGI